MWIISIKFESCQWCLSVSTEKATTLLDLKSNQKRVNGRENMTHNSEVIFSDVKILFWLTTFFFLKILKSSSNAIFFWSTISWTMKKVFLVTHVDLKKIDTIFKVQKFNWIWTLLNVIFKFKTEKLVLRRNFCRRKFDFWILEILNFHWKKN